MIDQDATLETAYQRERCRIEILMAAMVLNADEEEDNLYSIRNGLWSMNDDCSLRTSAKK